MNAGAENGARDGAAADPVRASGSRSVESRTGQLRLFRDGPLGAEIHAGAGEFRSAAARTGGDSGAECQRQIHAAEIAGRIAEAVCRDAWKWMARK